MRDGETERKTKLEIHFVTAIRISCPNIWCHKNEIDIFGNSVVGNKFPTCLSRLLPLLSFCLAFILLSPVVTPVVLYFYGQWQIQHCKICSPRTVLDIAPAPTSPFPSLHQQWQFLVSLRSYFMDSRTLPDRAGAAIWIYDNDDDDDALISLRFRNRQSRRSATLKHGESTRSFIAAGISRSASYSARTKELRIASAS